MLKKHRKILEKQISGALRATFVAHGQINKNNMSSATKRIAGQLLSNKEIILNEEEFKIRIINFLEYHHSQLLRNREILRQCKNDQNILTLRAKGKILGKMLNELRRVVFGGEIPAPIEKFLKHNRNFEAKRNTYLVTEPKGNGDNGRETSLQKYTIV